jgi:hypothetical protein
LVKHKTKYNQYLALLANNETSMKKMIIFFMRLHLIIEK